MTVCPKGKGVQAPCGARVRAAIGLAPWAAQVPPTERAGSEGSYIESLRWRGGRPAGASIKCCLRQHPPFGGWRHHLPAHFVVGLWVLGSGVNLSLWQQRRENHTTGLRPWKTNQPSCGRGNAPLLPPIGGVSPEGEICSPLSFWTHKYLKA